MNTGSHKVRPDPAISDALDLLGKHRFSLAIHDSCFPRDSADDIGRGTPYSSGARTFFAFARGLGFDAIQLGPQGQTGRENPSPYDGTLFSRNSLNLDLGALADTLDDSGQSPGLLDRTLLDQLVTGCPDQSHSHTQHAYAHDACAIALSDIYRHFCNAREQGDPVIAGLAAGLVAFTARENEWLQADALYHALATEHNGLHHRDWPKTDQACPDSDLYRHAAVRDTACALRRAQLQIRFAQGIERYCLSQFLLQRQHSALRGYLRQLGLRIYGDLQVGISSCDEWSRGSRYLQGYSMGAPPSRTNPAGQPWGYGVLDPEQYLDASGEPGPAMRLLLARVGRLVQEFDGLRIDHPHGLVCPWVYASDDPDPYHAVQHGARLFSSPDLEDKPGLARYAIARPEQLNKAVPRHADDWVQWLDDAQLDRYAILVDAIVSGVLSHGGAHEDILCEVLSTLPYPLQRVITRHGLGRFRVTQKADLANPADVYRSENAAPADWIMVGNHDTPSLWRLARRWVSEGSAPQQAAYLAGKLRPGKDCGEFAQELAGSRCKLVHAKVADIFASPAQQVMVFFSDLLGIEDDYNQPGVPGPDNWTLRVPPDYAARYAESILQGKALNLPCVLLLALQARDPAFSESHGALLVRLRELAGWWVVDEPF